MTRNPRLKQPLRRAEVRRAGWAGGRAARTRSILCKGGVLPLLPVRRPHRPRQPCAPRSLKAWASTLLSLSANRPAPPVTVQPAPQPLRVCQPLRTAVSLRRREEAQALAVFLPTESAPPDLAHHSPPLRAGPRTHTAGTPRCYSAEELPLGHAPPHLLARAARGCISAKTGRETAALNSVPLAQSLLVLRRRPCSRDAAGAPTPGAFAFHTEFIRVPVGCTCVLPRSA
ncbi:hypothetical protein E2I00_019648, partial [Balaenoptera physalus]